MNNNKFIQDFTVENIIFPICSYLIAKIITILNLITHTIKTLTNVFMTLRDNKFKVSTQPLINMESIVKTIEQSGSPIINHIVLYYE